MRRSVLLALFCTFLLPFPANAGGSGHEVEARDNVFVPESITVSVGSELTFRNTGRAPHNVAAQDGSFKIDIINAGQSQSIKLEKVGTFPYICEFHQPEMKGTIVVQEATGANAPATGSSSPTPVSDVQDGQAPPVGAAVPADEGADESPAPNPLAVSPLPATPTEKYFPIGAVGLLVLLLMFGGILYVRMVVMKTASRRA